jgi:dipeptidyl-peptidase-4
MRFALAIAAAVALMVSPAAARDLTLDDIYGSGAIRLDNVPTGKWLGSGDAYTLLDGDIVRIDSATGARSVLVSAATLRPAGAVSDYDWSPDGKLLLLFVRAPEARRNNPNGDYWLLDPGSGALRRLGGGLPAKSLLYAQFAPDGSKVAYVSGNNLFVEAVAGGAPKALTSDGNAVLLNGRSDVVYEEEFGLGRAFAWSPDSRRIAYWQFDTSGVGTFYMIRNTGGTYSQPILQQYPQPGTTNSAVRIGMVSADAPGTVWVALDGDPRQNYVPRMDWAGGQLLIQHENRLQNSNRVMLADPATGAARLLMTESDKAWLLPNEDIHWLSHGRAFTWISERDGWRHLYLASRETGKLELRTPGAFDVISIARIDEAAGYAWFIASPDNPTQRYLYRASLRGKPKVERLTPADAPGTHDYDVAPGGKWAFHTVSRFDAPPRVELIDLAGNRPARLLAGNARMQALLADTPRSPAEFFRVDAGDGTMLDAWMIKPPGFDPAKRYPMLVHVYSEPAGQTVTDRWGGSNYLWHLMLAQQGYLVASIDSRGAASPRGRDWRRSIYGQIGILASADQAGAIRAMLASRPYIDSARIGVWGWSGGGAMTLNALFRYPDLYRMGIAVAAPTDQRLYNSIYQERYMGLPEANPKGYADGSPINFAQNLKGDLLIVHGTADDNVHYQNMERLVDALIAHNKRFTMMAYPDRTHGIYEKANTRLHLFTMMTDYVHAHLPAGGVAR